MTEQRSSFAQNFPRVAVATSGRGVVDLHFGKADCFHIYEYNGEKGFCLLEARHLAPGCVNCSAHDAARIQGVVEALADCGTVVAAKIGAEAQIALRDAGVVPLAVPGEGLPEVLSALARFHARQLRARSLAAEDENELDD